MLSQIDPENVEWAKIVKDSLDFGLLAAKHFEKDGSEDKGSIFKTVGSNPIFLDQNLHFQLRCLFFTYQEAARITNTEMSRLEPENGLLNQARLKTV